MVRPLGRNVIVVEFICWTLKMVTIYSCCKMVFIRNQMLFNDPRLVGSIASGKELGNFLKNYSCLKFISFSVTYTDFYVWSKAM